MPANPLADNVIRALRTMFWAGFAGWPDEVRARAAQMLDRIMPEQWPLEWALPIWLGDAWGLPSDAGQELAACNLFGLVYVRLQDELFEGIVAEDTWPTNLGLANAAYQQALARYARLFAGHPTFWSMLDELMARWLRAQLTSNEPSPIPFAEWQHSDFLRLAERGAPLHIGGVGAALLAGRADLLPALRDTIDLALVANVLLDHAQDWQDDLSAGRYNAFIAYASALAQTPDHVQTNRQHVLEALYWNNAARPYFDIIQRYLTQAIAAAGQTYCPMLHDHLVQLRDDTANSALIMQRQLDERYHSAIATALGDFTFINPFPTS